MPTGDQSFQQAVAAGQVQPTGPLGAGGAGFPKTKGSDLPSWLNPAQGPITDLLSGIMHLFGGGGGGGGAKKPAGPAAAPAAPSAPENPIVPLLNAILGQQQGMVPQGYADFFTQVMGPMQEQLAKAFHAQMAGSLMGGNAGIPGMSPADAAVVNKARGAESADLDAMTQSAMQMSGPGAQGLQNFVLGPIANTQKLVSALQQALAGIPYQATGSSPLSQAVLSLFGGGTQAAPAAASSTSTGAPALPG